MKSSKSRALLLLVGLHVAAAVSYHPWGKSEVHDFIFAMFAFLALVGNIAAVVVWIDAGT